ncbi:MAG: hypothetical protein RL033_14 [Pseudomonadota bacterium]|jgi:DNA-binding transcriptional MerR regulator
MSTNTTRKPSAAAATRTRNRYTRERSKRARPSTPAPEAGGTINQLSLITQLSVRRLRRYVELGIMAPLELRGTATRYQRREMLRLLVSLQLKAETQFTLSEIKLQLDSMAEAELESKRNLSTRMRQRSRETYEGIVAVSVAGASRRGVFAAA